MSDSFLSKEELKKLGLKKLGNNVLISRKASFYGAEQIEIGNNVRIDDFCILSGTIIIGNYVHISAYTALYGKNIIEIHNFSGLSPRCTVFSSSDDFSGDFLIGPMIPIEYRRLNEGKVKIGPYSQIGAGSIIMPNVEIGDGVTIGAMSFIKKSLEPWAIYAGNPVRLIRKRSRKLIELSEKIR